MFTPLIPSLPAFGPGGVPYSPRYGDIYHAAQGAIEQARHVFLAGNGLPGRWQGRERFTVCETGFGLGLTFLTLWRAWRDDPRRCRRLHVVSVEAHPFSREHLAALLAAQWPAAWQDMASQLLDQWPPLLPGLHRLDLDGGAVTLTLAFGLAEQIVPQLALGADAFFLDGFDPARNPQMWSEGLMKALARLAVPDATAATWTSAGLVRRALQAAGFEVEKRAGFGGKRHMTVARFAPRFERRHAPVAPSSFAERHAVVLGAGIAGAGVAHALALRGWRVTVLDAAWGAPAAAPGHLAAALTPLLAKDDSPRARLSRAGALRAASRWAPWMDGDVVARCGTVQQAKSDAAVDDMHAMLQVLGFPGDWVRAVTRDEASALAGCATARGGVFFPGGLRVRPRKLCAALLASPAITVRAALAARLGSRPADVPGGRCWQVMGQTGEVLTEAEVVVVATASDAPRLLAASGFPARSPARFFEQKAIAGQITLLPAPLAGEPRCVVAGDGYVLPPVDGWCVAGSTYVHDAAQAMPTAEGHAVNLGKVARLLPGFAPSLPDPAGLTGWAGWRAVLPGRLPVIAELPGAAGLWVASGYASRGLSWSALAGDSIGASLEGEPQILERDLVRTVGWR
ncbi:MAG: FAD-dependent 5-carboxymethylaminomethyl-2-thiouridine(34) oxidoreductase MnmC [Pigmentiphaga sp.]|uniref:FAD-dependent 5-carboxymethylaminomethyl-2-thiouridine(34) oxidoreductase MnmC n=1 Tax=Pigmentiphaga sp. TaxID=1977564 RepID=UPI0029A838E7|nr:FAD-dependent 5-carboxymethylaminomethyl-2-thiouridine(34) oxidoreductase MnmC [Pigmentiphaga sp.]MDX3906827.1 FAD-dependent 5-carboxymethylaminomethyl-2-thiouridine(34) oxidoreductase MnmC [Pigmentiphaga sp.]